MTHNRLKIIALTILIIILVIYGLSLYLAGGDIILFFRLLVENKFELIQWISDSR